MHASTQIADSCCSLKLHHISSAAINLVSKSYRVPENKLRRQNHRPAEVAQARQLCFYLVHVTYGLSQVKTGLLFLRDRTTIAHACRAVENLRENDLFDLQVSHLERAFMVIANDAFSQREPAS